MKNSPAHEKASSLSSMSLLLCICSTIVCSFAILKPATIYSKAFSQSDLSKPRTLSIEQRVDYQRRIEEVYWKHQNWPKENSQPKPALDEMISSQALRSKVEDYLLKSQALELYWQAPITEEQLQAEMDRMAAQTRMPSLLNELWGALKYDPYLIAECLARPLLADKLLRQTYTTKGNEDQNKHNPDFSGTTFDAWWKQVGNEIKIEAPNPVSGFTLPVINFVSTTCTDDTWKPTAASVSDPRAGHSAVWTGNEMIVWGGGPGVGGRYNPDTNIWTSTNSLQSEFEGKARVQQTVIWTGTHMIIWGGIGSNSGSKYDPVTDLWTLISSVNAPGDRTETKAIWTGTEMIVWGGAFNLRTGGKYNPVTDIWTPTSTVNAPDGRAKHTLVWSGTQMLVWGGENKVSLNSGGRYDPVSDTWTAMQTLNAPSARTGHTAVWTGTDMIIWGGAGNNDGGRYHPSTDSWTPTNLNDAPAPRDGHTAIWTGSEMIVWGGTNNSVYLDTGGKYNPATDSWIATNLNNAPGPRFAHTAVWTNNVMIIWGGSNGSSLNTGARYNPSTDQWTTTDTTVVPKITSQKTFWTGSEMLIWGQTSIANTPFLGLRYNPALETWIPTSTINAPALSVTSGIWTGTEMILWGGGNNSSYFNSGRRYNVLTDSWTSTSLTNAPESRIGHSAIWTGSEMIIWGGSNGNTFLSTGGRYNPSTNSWTDMSSLNAPAVMSGYLVVWTNTEMILWGGSGNNNGGRYNPSTDSWAPISVSNAPNPQSSYTAVWTGSEMILWSGLTPGGKYNPTTDSWLPISGGPMNRAGHTAVWTGSEMIIWGGYIPPPIGAHCTTYPGTGARYEPITDVWRDISQPGAPSPRTGHSAVWTGSEMIIWGGSGPIPFCFSAGLDSGGRYCASYVPADTTISNSASVNSAQSGSNVTYTIIVTNTGPNAAPGVQVTDNLPPTLSFVSCSASNGGVCAGQGNNRTVTFASLAVNTSATITITAKVDCAVTDGSTVTNTATVHSATQDPNSANDSASAQIIVTNPPPSIAPSNQSFSSSGGTGNVSITIPGGCSWMATSNDNWISVASGAGGTGNGTVNYTVGANNNLNLRMGTMTIAGQTFTVNQAGITCAYSILPTGRSHGSSATTDIVSVTSQSPCSWMATSQAPWITITSGASGTGNGLVAYSLAENTVGISRSGTINMGGEIFTVNQTAASCAFSVQPTSDSFTSTGGSSSVTITATSGCAWTAVSNAAWIQVTSGSSGTGSGSLTYAVDANNTISPRSGTINVEGQAFTIYQGIAFLDVPPNHPFYNEIGKLSARGVTLGCGGGNYCPDSIVTREQMAAFIMRARGEFNPPAPGTQRFLDVPPSNPFYAFIDRMAELQITLGCGGGNYCPSSAVLREQMAAFMIRALHEPGYIPPPPGAQRFNDVPPSHAFYAHIEEMATRGITLGCSANPPLYCPGNEVTRAQMAAFLVRAFNL